MAFVTMTATVYYRLPNDLEVPISVEATAHWENGQ
jgi:hypothetical protein